VNAQNDSRQCKIINYSDYLSIHNADKDPEDGELPKNLEKYRDSEFKILYFNDRRIRHVERMIDLFNSIFGVH